MIKLIYVLYHRRLKRQTLAAISAVLLNWFYNGAPDIDEAELREAGHVAEH